MAQTWQGLNYRGGSSPFFGDYAGRAGNVNLRKLASDYGWVNPGGGMLKDSLYDFFNSQGAVGKGGMIDLSRFATGAENRFNPGSVTPGLEARRDRLSNLATNRWGIELPGFEGQGTLGSRKGNRDLRDYNALIRSLIQDAKMQRMGGSGPGGGNNGGGNNGPNHWNQIEPPGGTGEVAQSPVPTGSGSVVPTGGGGSPVPNAGGGGFPVPGASGAGAPPSGSGWQSFIQSISGVQSPLNEYESDVLGGEYLDFANRPEFINMIDALQREYGESLNDSLGDLDARFAGGSGTLGLSGARAAANERLTDDFGENLANSIAKEGFNLYGTERGLMNNVDDIWSGRTQTLYGAGASAYGADQSARAQITSARINARAAVESTRIQAQTALETSRMANALGLDKLAADSALEYERLMQQAANDERNYILNYLRTIGPILGDFSSTTTNAVGPQGDSLLGFLGGALAGGTRGYDWGSQLLGEEG